ncbi:MAG: magnesium transporter [Paracoccaceae bacterium]|jgi:magnesium transporter
MTNQAESTTGERLIPLILNFVRENPVAAAHHIDVLDEVQALWVLEALPHRDLAIVLAHLDPTFASKVVLASPPERVVRLLECGGTETCASILLSLPDAKRKAFLGSMSENLREQVQEILAFPEDSAGRVMKTDYTSFPGGHTVARVVAKLKARAGTVRAPSNIYVVEMGGKLAGVVSMRDLMIAGDETTLRSLMNSEVLTVGPFDTKSDAYQILSGRGFTSLPVVDSQGRMLGVVRATSLLADAQQSAAQDVQKYFGVSKNEVTFSPIGLSLRKRLPWLHINLATAFAAASVVAMFEDIIAKITVLAIYLPVVAGQGGNAGAQSLAVVMRGLVMREIPGHMVRRMLIKEGVIGVINGVVIGLVTGLIAWKWNGKPYLGLVIGLAMIVNLAAAGIAGAAIPIAMKRFGLDPAQSSSIVLTTVTDVVGFFAFLGFAVVFQDQLI